MNKLRSLLFVAIISFSVSNIASAQNLIKTAKPPTLMSYMVEAYPEYTNVVKAINTARLEETFEGKGPVTVFAPVNKAFEAFPAGTLDNWLKPESKDSLKKILTYHVVSGTWDITNLAQKVKEGGGEFSMPTLGEGGRLSFILENGQVAVKDARGFKTILAAPVKRDNGLLYSLDKLLLP